MIGTLYVIHAKSEEVNKMETEQDSKGYYHHGKKVVYNNGMNAVYGLGFVGATVYFLQHASTFGDGVIGILKALGWPAVLVYQWLGFFKI